MKKTFIYLFALLCSMAALTSCGDSDDEKHPWSGTYYLTEYTVDSEKKNEPTAGALYVDWAYDTENNLPLRFSSFFRYMGGGILPQVMNAIILEKNGNIRANIINEPTLSFAAPVASDVMKIMMGTYNYPSAEEISASFPNSGFTTSAKGLAYWSEDSGKLVLKLNIASIITAAMGEGSKDMEAIIGQLLSSSNTETIKGLLGAMLGADLSGVSNTTILQLLGWINDGIPMTYEATEDGHTRIYLEKNALNNLFAVHDGTYDMKILWDALVAGGIVPEEAKAAGTLITTIGNNWSKTSKFNIGLDLQKK